MKNKEAKQLFKSKFKLLILVLFICLFVFIVFYEYNKTSERIKNYHWDSLDMIDQRMSSLFLELNNFHHPTVVDKI